MKNISIVAPASWIKDEYLFSAVNFLKSNGFKLKYAEQVRQTQNSYTAGSDADRINSLHEAFQNPETDIILCAKGGYGTSRIIDKLDVNILNNPHKIFLGYSDISLLNFFLIKYAPLTKVYFCPNLIDIAYLNCNPQENTLKYLINFLHRLPDQATLNQLLSQTKILKHGRAHTQIIGGTLTIMMNCLGTPFELDTNNKILFIEDKKD